MWPANVISLWRERVRERGRWMCFRESLRLDSGWPSGWVSGEQEVAVCWLVWLFTHLFYLFVCVCWSYFEVADACDRVTNSQTFPVVFAGVGVTEEEVCVLLIKTCREKKNKNTSRPESTRPASTIRFLKNLMQSTARQFSVPGVNA